MHMTTIDDLLRDLAAETRAVEPSAGAIDASVRRAERQPRRHRARRRLVPTFARPGAAALAGVLLVLAGGTMAVPATRAAIVGAFENVFGDGSSGGARLTGSEVPPWIERDAQGVRTIAGHGHERLISYRERGFYCVTYGDSVGECSSQGDWLKTLADHPVVLRGPTGGIAEPRRTLYGLTVGTVAEVRIDYERGPATVADASAGGFAITADLTRAPTVLTAVDAAGHTVTTIDVAARMRG
jgi:hypothetical protein